MVCMVQRGIISTLSLTSKLWGGLSLLETCRSLTAVVLQLQLKLAGSAYHIAETEHGPSSTRE